MTTTKTQLIETLAAQLLATLNELSTHPLVGYFPEYAALNRKWEDEARTHLHSFIEINLNELVAADDEWLNLFEATGTIEQWQEYGA